MSWRNITADPICFMMFATSKISFSYMYYMWIMSIHISKPTFFTVWLTSLTLELSEEIAAFEELDDDQETFDIVKCVLININDGNNVIMITETKIIQQSHQEQRTMSESVDTLLSSILVHLSGPSRHISCYPSWSNKP